MQPTQRFSKTVENYVKYRPSYPVAVINVLEKECGLTRNSIIADVGSGSGLFSKLLLEHGNQVYGVEPNTEMRKAGEVYLGSFANFHSVEGTAEQTNLPDQSIDIVTVATAFHWFDPIKTKIEFQRILKSQGWCVLVWNVRDAHSPLVADYEKLITRFGTDYCTTNAVKFDHTVTAEFFAPFRMQIAEFPNKQIFDWDGFKGRLLSSSYSLQENDEHYAEMLSALLEIFKRYEKNAKVEFSYLTKMYFGRLKE